MKERARYIQIWFIVLTLSFMSMVILGFPAEAAYVKNVPVTLKQPNGETLSCFTTGDEYYHWFHDADDYVIIKDSETRYYVYASISNDDLRPTPYIPGKVNPKAVGLKRYVNPSPQKLDEIRMSHPIQTLVPEERRPAPTSGTVNNIVIFVRFSDEAEFADPIDMYDDMFNDPAPDANSMHNYLKEVSYDQAIINTTFYPATSGTTVVSYQDSNPRAYYQPFDAALNPEGYTSGAEHMFREHDLLANAVNAIADQVPVDLNIDADNDGLIDNVTFIISGGPDAWGGLLWPHMWVLFSQNVYINSKQVWTYNLHTRDFLTYLGTGVLCHEMFHSLGAPDLYHYNGDGLEPVGIWDIMDATDNPPQHMGAYMKYRYGGWINSIPELTTTGTYTLNPLTSSTENCYKIASPNSTTEYYVLEYRQQNGVFENSLPGSGLLVYRINTTCDGNGNEGGPPDEVYLFRPGGSPTANGTPYNANFCSDVGRIEINDITDPYCFLSDGSTGGLIISDIGAADETISFTFTSLAAAIPEFNPDGGTFTSPVDVTISCAMDEVTIRYTTDGNDPTASDPVIASGDTITISSSLTLKARVWKDGWYPSAIAVAEYTITGQVATPTLSPDGGTFTEAQTVTISCETEGATIYYTTDGSDPTDESDEYIAPIVVSETQTIKAIAYKDEWDPSAIAMAEYIITGAVPAPTFSPDGGAFSAFVDVTISCAMPDVTICYTTDGTDPTLSSPTVANGDTVRISSSSTLKAKAWKDNWDPSTVKSAVYTIRIPIVIRVKPDGNNANNGSSWELAKKTIQGAINAAEMYDEVWVKTGTYTGCVKLKSYVSIYGGFSGNGNERNRTANITILDGGGSGSVITAPPGVTSETVVDGFTIRNGNALTGGGIVCNGSSPTISNNIITANTALNGGGGIYCSNSSAVISNNTITGNISKGHGGGGIHCCFSSSATISDNTISGNTAYQGGGIACYNSNPEIINNILTSNTASMNYGGGIHCYNSSPSIRNNIISENKAWRGGGINCYYSSVPTIVNNTIAENTASSAGGGIYSLGGTIMPDSTLNISNNIIAFNSSGICCAAGTMVLKNNCVYGNTGYNYLGLTSSRYATDILGKDPLFVDKTAKNYHIQSISPCVNAGDNSKAYPLDRDIDNQPRIQSIKVDIGADEYSST